MPWAAHFAAFVLVIGVGDGDGDVVTEGEGLAAGVAVPAGDAARDGVVAAGWSVAGSHAAEKAIADTASSESAVRLISFECRFVISFPSFQ